VQKALTGKSRNIGAVVVRAKPDEQLGCVIGDSRIKRANPLRPWSASSRSAVDLADKHIHL